MKSLHDAPRYPKPEALVRLPDYGHAVIEASAGTGKTHTIEHLVVDLLVTHGIDVGEILVVTFTEKAAAELRRRIRGKLGELLALESTATDIATEHCWVIDDEARQRLEAARVRFDTAPITTIHGFCHSVLTENAFSNGCRFDPERIDGRAAFSRAFRDVLRTDLSRSDDLFPYLVAWLELRQSGVHALEELLYEAWQAKVPIDVVEVEDRLASLADRITLPGGSTESLMESGVDKRSVPKVLRNLEALEAALAEYRKTRDSIALIAELDDVELRYLDEKLGGLGELRSAVPSLSAAMVTRFLPPIEERLGQIKRGEGLIDFDDMLEVVARSLEGPRGDELARTLQRRYRYALVDEFQDTDETQWSIFRRLFFQEGAKNPLRLVGDPKQAIYGFRGADVHVYLEARSALVARSAMVNLVDNFRSTPDLIDALNLVFDQKATPPFFTGNVRYDRPIRAGCPELGLVGSDGRHAFPLVLMRSDGDKKALAGHIAREIEGLTNDPGRDLRFGPEGREVPLGTGDIIVLTRTGREAEEIGEALAARGIPFAFYKREGLFQTREAEEVRDFLAALVDLRDRGRRLRAWMTRFFGLSLRDLERCGDVPLEHPLMGRLVEWKRLADAEAYDLLFSRVLEESGILRRELFAGRGERRLVNYVHIFEALLEEVQSRQMSLRELLDTLESFISGRGLAPGSEKNVMRLENDGAVQVMTIHMAKGLEAAIVFVYAFGGAPARTVHRYYQGAEKRMYVGRLGEARTTIRDAVERERLEEDQRLFYVALTRAKARLYLPLLPDDGAGLGCYRQVNRRLHELLGVFKIADVVPDREPEPSVTRPVETWQPPEDLLAAPIDVSRFDRSRDRSRGWVITSYSRLKRLSGGDPAPEERRFDRGEPALPGGSGTGIFLHDVLESVDFATVRESSDFEGWRARDDVRRIFRAAMRRNAVEPRHRSEAERLVYVALTTPVTLGDRRLDGGFASLETELREVEFVYPYPEPDGQLRRGFVSGFVDFVFEHDGLTYFCDWKSDFVASWDDDDVADHVRRYYALQAKLYTLALVKMLEVENDERYRERFGGLIYCFLRGMPDAGTYFERPSWSTVSTWTDELAREEL